MDELLNNLTRFHVAANNASQTTQGIPNSRAATSQAHHELKIEYPVVELVPSDRATFDVNPPRNMKLRHQPDQSNFHVNSGYDYRILIPVAGVHSWFDNNEHGTSLQDTIQRLIKAPGQSVLQAALLRDKFNNPFCRIRLVTQRGIENVVAFDDELTNAAFEVLLDRYRQETWAQLLSDLVHIGSDYAYFHVVERLGANNLVMARLHGQWNQSIPRHVAALLAGNMQKVTNVGARQFFSPLSIEDVSDDKVCEVRLPCWHIVRIAPRKVFNRGSRQCTTFSCPTCDMRIMREEDIQGVEERKRHLARRKWAASEVLWRDLDEQNFHPHDTVQVASAYLKLAIENTLEHLRLPSAVMPYDLCTANAGFIFLAKAKVRERIGDGPGVLSGPLQDIYAFLLSCANEVVNRHDPAIPKDWDAFVARWFSRALKLAATEKYAGQTIDALYGKEHHLAAGIDSHSGTTNDTEDADMTDSPWTT